MYRPDRVTRIAGAAVMLLAGLLAAVPGRAASLLDRSFGTPELGVSARLRGMGSTGGALGDGGLGLLDNPVSPALNGGDPKKAGLTIQLSGGFARASENRLVPLYDTFDSYVVETAIAVNDHQYGALDLGAAFRHPMLRGTVIGFSTVGAYDPRYDYYDERRTTATTDQIVSERYITTTGILRETGLSAAHALPWGVTAGVAGHLYSGTIEDRDALVPHQNGVTGTSSETRRELLGTSMSLGLAWRMNERLTTAASWESGPRFHDTFTVTQNDSVIVGPDGERIVWWPARVHLSGAYRPRNSLRTVFAADAIWSAWSAVTDPADPARKYMDAWDVRFGLEHEYLRNLPGRIGFRYERSPVTREADRAWFTFGGGWKADRFDLDASIELAKRTSRQEPVWPRAEQGGAVGAGLDTVEDTFTRITFGVKTSF